MSKNKFVIPKGYITKVLNSIPPGKLLRIKNCVRVGYQMSHLMSEFNLSEKWAYILIEKYKLGDPNETNAILGHKNEPYYEEEFPVIPEYKLKDLTGEEKYIARKGPKEKFKLWGE